MEIHVIDSPPIPSGTDQNSTNINGYAIIRFQIVVTLAYDGIQCSLIMPNFFFSKWIYYIVIMDNWINSFVCVDQNYLNYCHSGSDCSGNGITTDTNRQDGCTLYL